MRKHVSPEEHISQFKRIVFLEKYIMFPVKVLVFLFSVYFLWTIEHQDRVEVSYYKQQLGLYAVANLVFLLILIGIGQRKMSFAIVKIAAFFLSVIDNLFLSFLIFFSGGMNSELFWVYCGIMIRNAVNFPTIRYQQTINAAFCLFYIGAVWTYERNLDFIHTELFQLRIIVLILVSFCCWGIYALVLKRRRQASHVHELAIRTERLALAERMAAEIAHEIKNPLSVINNAAYYIGNHIGKAHESLQKQIAIAREVSIIQEEVKRADTIISGLLSLSHVGERKIVNVDVNTVIRGVLEGVKERISKHNVRVRKQLSSDMPGILFDQRDMYQVVFNIVMNALESYTDDKQRAVLEIAADYVPPDGIEIVVTDNGCGMTPDDKERVFTPFFTTKERGSGLGLSIVNSIVATYNGRIEVDSTVGKGTTFRVLFPIRTHMEEMEES